MKYFYEDEQKVGSLVDAIRNRVSMHKNLYSSPIKAELWEEVLHRSFKDIGIVTDWQPDGNHKVGVDMTLESGERVSCKTGSFNNSDLTISGSRLTKHKSLSAKIAFISDKKEDTYALLSRDKEDKQGENYKLIMFPSSMLNYGQLNWYGDKNYRASSNLLECSIQHSMSDQLWTKIKDFENQEKIVCIDI